MTRFARRWKEGACPACTIATTCGDYSFTLPIKKRSTITAITTLSSGVSHRPSSRRATGLNLSLRTLSDVNRAQSLAQTAETLAILLKSLGDAQLQKIAVYKMEGRTVDEIAKEMGCARSTIERKLRRIRHEWMERVA